MNRQKMLAQIGSEIETNMPSLGAWQRAGLALMVFSLLGGAVEPDSGGNTGRRELQHGTATGETMGEQWADRLARDKLCMGELGMAQLWGSASSVARG